MFYGPGLRFLALASVFVFVRVLYLLIERLLISPLRKIPGPKIAALTGWYETYYDVFLPGKYVFRIKEMHEEYGPIVRISPRLISISDCDFLDTIYEGNQNSKRDKDSEMVKAMGFSSSIGGAWQHDLHRKRRQPLNNFFSQGTVFKFEPELSLKVQQLRQIFANTKPDTVINLSDIYFAFASDVVGQFVFGDNQNVLADLPKAHQTRLNVAKTLRGVKIGLNFSWIVKLIMSLPESVAIYFAPPSAAEMQRFRAAARKDIERVIQEEKTFVRTEKRSIFRELWNSPLLPPSEKTVLRFEDEATLMVMAGTESPAKSISIAHFYLLQNPEVMKKLRDELNTTKATTLPQLLQLPYLNAIATEANRLSFGLTGRNSRVAHESLVYTDPNTRKSYKLPVGTPLSTSTLDAHTNGSIFPDPWSFNPDRWMGEVGKARKKYMLSLGKGTRMCIGMNLANAELAVTIAEMAQWQMTLWNTEEDDIKFAHDWHVAHPRLSSEGVRVQVMGRC